MYDCGVEKWKSLWKTIGNFMGLIFDKNLKIEKWEMFKNVLTAENGSDLYGLQNKKRGTCEEHDPGVVNHASFSSCLLYQYMRLWGIYAGKGERKNQYLR